eukprot:CAMPEP_0195509510 /NCGR_PEP_ID=MMETSP0794_2-20130614/2424_1 /TAXON_ID=515487 /ORGANISM="Stephanopyxis turris, Strain CCMP 815" /LENGTH=420 /DNA_ID=CAMNT_0040636749 /DNA_START=110 /DNA_END=1373 /DNA_ORIENTATION=-
MSSPTVIVSMARTPIAKFCGSFQSLTAPELGSIAIRGALDKLEGSDLSVDEAYLGNVISAGIGQAPARQREANNFSRDPPNICINTKQAIMGANLPTSTICTTINKVCASGMKATMVASQSISLDPSRVLISGGFESMSNAPHYLPKSRNPYKLGNSTVLDGVIHDGLWDVYKNQHMGMCGEKCAVDYGISREEQDEYAIGSYTRAQSAMRGGKFEDEIVSVSIPQRKGANPTIVSTDEEISGDGKILDKIPTLRPAFQTDGSGTITAGNASSLNDGASALVLMSEEKARSLDITPLARILGFGDAEQSPEDFTTAPSLAIPKALQNASNTMTLNDVDYHEINEAFSVVSLANIKILDLDPTTVNVFGGAVALGHPIGSSGARIIATLISVLKDRDGTVGCASICNGGGGASAIVIERLH